MKKLLILITILPFFACSTFVYEKEAISKIDSAVLLSLTTNKYVNTQSVKLTSLISAKEKSNLLSLSKTSDYLKNQFLKQKEIFKFNIIQEDDLFQNNNYTNFINQNKNSSNSYSSPNGYLFSRYGKIDKDIIKSISTLQDADAFISISITYEIFNPASSDGNNATVLSGKLPVKAKGYLYIYNKKGDVIFKQYITGISKKLVYIHMADIKTKNIDSHLKECTDDLLNNISIFFR